MKKVLKILLAGFVLWVIFFLFFVFPDPFFSAKPFPAEKTSPGRVGFDLIDHLTTYSCSGKWVRRDPFLGGCQVSLGRYRGLVESKRAIPSDREITFKYIPAEGSRFIFSTGTAEKNAIFQIFVDSEKIFERKLSAPPVRGWFYHHFLKYFHFHPKWEGGIWETHSLSLSRWKGKDIKITLRGKGGYWGNPQIIEAGDELPNIIMIQVDALRADLVGKGVLPNIDKLASEGAYFKNAYSNGNWTRPSNVHQFFARYNREMGLSPEHFFLSDLEKRIFYQRKFLSIPSILKKNGYRTKAIGDNIFLHGYSSLGIDFGFEEVMDMERERYQSPLIFEEATRWLRKNRGTPFFLFLDFNQTHRPYRPPVNRVSMRLFLRNYHFALYQGCAAYTDEYIGKLLQWLEASGLIKNTLIVLNADHGERFHTRPDLQPHGETLLEEEIRVPIIFYWRGKIKPHGFITPISIIDIPKTALSLTGITPPESWRGRDLSEFILKGKEPPQAPVILEGRRDKGIIYKGWKLITEGERTVVKRIMGKERISPEELREKLSVLYPTEPEVLLVRFNVKEGSFKVSPLSSIEVSGTLGDVEKNQDKIKVTGNGYVYFIFKNGEIPEIDFFKERLNFTQMEIPWGETKIVLNPDTREKLRVSVPYFFERRKGFTIATIPLLSFVYSPQFSSARGFKGLESILIEWGYMKK